MPELPEVETIMLGITPFLEGATITKVKLNRSDLRWPFPENFAKRLEKAKVLNLKRRSKYILVNLSTGETLLIHLGMSGTIHLLKKKNKNKFTNTSFYHSPHLPKKHNHVEIELQNISLIYNDPRRFGYLLYFDNKKQLQKKFKSYGPEPFSKKFNFSFSC